ncbi:MAG: hypothetical protein CM15mP107_2630 [Bacteroidota bacterium]|nr:MAG: hypothetical protein CM15mP107_2630 [Bacteroidota bacterium]
MEVEKNRGIKNRLRDIKKKLKNISGAQIKWEEKVKKAKLVTENKGLVIF